MVVVVPVKKVAPGWKLETKVGVLQLSVAVGGVHDAVAEVAFGADMTVIFEGQPEITGATVSAAQRFCTVTLNIHLAKLPSISEAV